MMGRDRQTDVLCTQLIEAHRQVDPTAQSASRSTLQLLTWHCTDLLLAIPKLIQVQRKVALFQAKFSKKRQNWLV